MSGTVVPCPLKPGLHFWLWPGGHGEGWQTAQKQAERALSLGATGVIPQAGLSAPKWLSGRDVGWMVPRVEVFRQAGLQVTAGFGMDGHNTAAAMIGAMVDGLRIADAIMGDWEAPSLWECSGGRALAVQIVNGVLANCSDAHLRSVDCPWWRPKVHRGAPTLEFYRLFGHRFVQAYGAPAKDNPTEITEWMYEEAVVEYADIYGIPPECVHPAEQAYGHTLAAAGRLLLCGHPVIALWDVEELDGPFSQALKAKKFLLMHDFSATEDGLKAFQRDTHISVDGILGPETLSAMRLT